MDDTVGKICQNCQMSFESMELLPLHSCVEIKQEISDVDEIISGDPLYVSENETEIKIEGGKDQLALIIEMVHEHNLKVQDGNNLHDKNTVHQEETHQLNINTNNVYEGMKEMVQKGYSQSNEDYCDICEKSFSKSYLKIHMLNKHKISKDQKDPNGNTENQMVKNSKTVHEEENLCPKCDANFRTVRRLRIHIEEVHEKRIETIVPKAKRQKMAATKIMPAILPPEPHETFTVRKLFDYLYCTKKIYPTNSEYRQHVKEAVLNFKKISMDKLSDSSLKALDSKAIWFSELVRRKWKKVKGVQSFHRIFEGKDTFMWTPEFKEDIKENEEKNKHLSDEFLTSIIKQVNDTCKNICDNDTDLERIGEVSQHLKNLSNCYQKILSDRQANL